MVVDVAGDADTAGLGQGLKGSGDVHAVAVDVTVLVDDVGEVDAYPQADPLIVGHRCLALGHALLDEHGAAGRVDGAAELAQEAVAQGFDDAPALLGDEAARRTPCGRP